MNQETTYTAPDKSGFVQMFKKNRLTLGLFFAIESYDGAIPTMKNQAELAKRADTAGFAVLWTRDVPLFDPSFGDAGQVFDPWVWLGYMTTQTNEITLATAAIVTTLHHPIDIAKAASSIDNLSEGRLLLGIASGDRPLEYPAYGIDFDSRGQRFTETLDYMNDLWKNDFPKIQSYLGSMNAGDLLPKPLNGRIPLTVIGNSRQSIEWIAKNADAWMMYPRDLQTQSLVIKRWQEDVSKHGQTDFKPFTQSLYIDLLENANAPSRPIHLGFSLGRNALIEYLKLLEQIGVNHVAFVLKYGKRPATDVVEELIEFVLPHFPKISVV